MQRRRFLGLAAAGLVPGQLATLTACGNEGLEEPVTLKVVAVEHGDRFGNSSKRYWDKVVGQFRFDHPEIDVRVELHQRGKIDARVRSLVEAGDPPDLAVTTGTFARYAQQDKLYKANDVLSTPRLGAFMGSLAEAGTVERVQYGIPFSVGTRAFFYNTELFAEAGIQQPPGSWEELRQAAQALRAVGVKTPYGLPFGDQEPQAETLNWMLSGGGGYTDAGGSYDIDSSENIATFRWLSDNLIVPGLTNKEPATTDRDEAYAAFTKGEVAMLNGHPGLVQLSLENGVRYGTAPLPGKNGPIRTTTGVADWMMAFKKNGYGKQMHKFLDFLFREKSVLDYAEAHALLPVTTPAVQRMREKQQHERLWPFLDRLDTARFYPVSKSSWGETVSMLKSTIGSALAEDGNPETVLGRLQRSATAAERAADSTT